MTIENVGVIGAGQMGAGIAQVMAQAGLNVVVTDPSPNSLENAQNGILKSIQKLIEKGVVHKDTLPLVQKKIRWTPEIMAQKDAQLIIEAVPEDEGLKTLVFEELDSLAHKDAIFASNTSSISITRMAAKTSRPEQFIGMHFMNPVPLMKLIEIIRGLQTDNNTYDVVCNLSRQLGKTITTSSDMPGFIANRILMPMINEAFYALMEGVGTAIDIDETMKLGAHHPMGPLALADFIGLDTCLAIMEVLHTGLGDTKYRPCPLLRTYVDGGYLGKKSKRGVFSYV